MKNVLIINTFGIGDVLFTTPLISNIRKAYPDAKITFWANKRTAEILRHNPDIHTVMVYERDDVKASGLFGFTKRWLGFVDKIKSGAFDVMFDFSQNRTFSGIAFFCGVKQRIGYDYRRRGIFLTHKEVIQGFEHKHVVEYYLDLLRFCHVNYERIPMSLPLPQESMDWALQWFKDQHLVVGQPIALVAGGGASWGRDARLKRWPASKFAELADKIVAQMKVPVILLGDSSEKALAEQIVVQSGRMVHSAVGETSVSQMAALMKGCRLAVVNDGGPLHVAVALGVKTVSIFGPVDDRVYGPWPLEGHAVVNAKLPCQPCYRRFRPPVCSHVSCLQHVSVEDVYRKVVESA